MCRALRTQSAVVGAREFKSRSEDSSLRLLQRIADVPTPMRAREPGERLGVKTPSVITDDGRIVAGFSWLRTARVQGAGETQQQTIGIALAWG
jgi:hypothetical protein